MRVKITKTGIFASDGKEVPVGTEMDVAREPLAWAGRYEVIASGGAGKAPVTNPAPPTYEAKHRGRGSYSVMDGAGNEVADGLSKDDAEAFNAMSAEDQAAYVTKG